MRKIILLDFGIVDGKNKGLCREWIDNIVASPLDW